MQAFPGVLMTSAGVSKPMAVGFHEAAHRQGAALCVLGIICTVSPGSMLTYSVEITGDITPIEDGFWNELESITNKTASANAICNLPITGVRLSVSKYNSGRVNMAVVRWS